MGGAAGGGGSPELESIPARQWLSPITSARSVSSRNDGKLREK